MTSHLDPSNRAADNPSLSDLLALRPGVRQHLEDDAARSEAVADKFGHEYVRRTQHLSPQALDFVHGLLTDLLRRTLPLPGEDATGELALDRTQTHGLATAALPAGTAQIEGTDLPRLVRA
ncbi:MAG TPA: hypothetical protein VLA88_01425, partial [Candidatus Saccharimonadales bacterium]|nr:hypothetical protein [Candidatus Saccharimonadales bacterium]